MLKLFIQYHLYILSCDLGLFLAQNASSQIMTKKYHLEGYWNFCVGDKPEWKQPAFNDSMWDQIKTGTSWESQGYNDYNGYAWYRRTLNIKSKPENKLYLKIGAIDDADQVYFNGELIGQKGGFPPHPETAYNLQRLYEIPAYLWKTGDNLIAIRVYDFYAGGGITGHPLAIYEDTTDDYLTLNLAGEWAFKPSSSSQYKNPDYNHSEWDKIKVPGRWEDQGWPYLDGIAWYRKSFYLPPGVDTAPLYLVLGRIDDEDEVYLNGEKIGETENGNSSWFRTAYRELRIYPIPNGLLSSSNPNISAVRVNDEQLDGGIYEGPIGLASKEQVEDIRSIMKEYKSAWETFWDWVNE